MRIAGCVLLIYFAAVSRMMSGDGLGACVDWSAIAVVAAMRWNSPAGAAALAFLMGGVVDALGTGPMGVHAGAAVATAAMLSRFGFAAESWSVLRWMSAVWIAVSVNALSEALMSTFLQGASGPRLESQAIMAIGTAAGIGVLVFGGRVLFGAACATR